jgi:hypothetical protein
VGDILFAKCWKMVAISSDTGQAWRVLKGDDYSVVHTDFLKTFPELCNDANTQYGLPHPSQLDGKYKPLIQPL